MADQRITGVNSSPEGGTLKPPTFDGLDHQRCASLHNHLIERGRREGTEVIPKTWWDLHGSSIDSVHQKLHPMLQKFLQLAWISWDGSALPGQLFWNISSIPGPDRLFSSGINEAYQGLDTLDHDMYDELDMYNAAEEDDELSDGEADETDSTDSSPLDLKKYRFVTLYEARSCSGDSPPLGVIYDQKLHIAVYVTSVGDIPALLNGHNTSKFNPLEYVLDAWHALMDRDKVVKTNGIWKMQHATPADIGDTVCAWNDLAHDIEARILDCEEGLIELGSVHTLLDPAAAASLALSDFRREFLTAARRPRFRYIAPGLRVPTSDELVERIRATTERQNEQPRMWESPLLLFAIPKPMAADDSYTWPAHYRSSLTQQVGLTDEDSTSGELLFPFAKGIKPDASFPPGLYLSSTGEDEAVPCADAFRLILPFTLGSNGQTYRNDFTWELGEDEVTGILGHQTFNSSPRYGELYQSGNGITRGIARHDAQLAKLFEAWKRQLGTSGWGLHFEEFAGVIGQIGGNITGVGIIEEYASSFERSGNYAAGSSN